MKTNLITRITFFLMVAVFTTTSTIANAQAKFSAQHADIRLTGTSTLHDWEMKANKATSEAFIVMGVNEKITSISNFKFVLVAKNLKSEKLIMDKNTYKALKTEDHPDISFVLTSSHLTPLRGNEYQITGKGKLTIAGTTREIDVAAKGTFNPADKSFTIHGSKKMKMTDFQVKPPTVMLGTIKTGDDITITYNLRLVK